VALGLALAEAGPDPEVALEATCGWYWAADVLQAAGARVHLVHTSGLHWRARRVKNDERDATEIAHRLRRNDLPEAWIAPPLYGQPSSGTARRRVGSGFCHRVWPTALRGL
jgi:transposase